MSNFKLMITNEGKHPASKWAEIMTEDIIDISEMKDSPKTLMLEATNFRNKLLELLTHHQQNMMDEEQTKLQNGEVDDDPNCPFGTEEHTSCVVEEICGLATGLSFEEHFRREDVIAHLHLVCNRYFQSSKLVERQHHHEMKNARRSRGRKNSN